MTEPPGLPFQRGAQGPIVSDLNRRLARAGLETSHLGDRFDDDTEAAVRSFQQARGLEATGRCDRATWSAVVEASYRLGDRQLYLHVPMLRGDDVATLQLLLGRLGFDAGRVDGIFGPDTQQALLEFQRNAGLVVDGIAGPDCARSLQRLTGRTVGPEPVTQVREREQLRHASPAVHGLRIAVGDLGGGGLVVSSCVRSLREKGADAFPIAPQTSASHARLANESAATLYLGVAVMADGPVRLTHFASGTFESQGGRRLGESLSAALAEHMIDVTHEGRATPILRETRMPAVVLRLAPAQTVVRHARVIAQAVASAVEDWAQPQHEEFSTTSSSSCG